MMRCIVIIIVPLMFMPITLACFPQNSEHFITINMRDKNGNHIEDCLEARIGEIKDEIDLFITYEGKKWKIIKSKLEELGKIKYKSKYLDVCIVKAKTHLIKKISGIEGIVLVEEAPKFKFCLDTSAPSINVDDVREKYGFTGRGVTICVVDTGIDARHASLNDLDDNNMTDDPKVIAFYDAAEAPDNTSGTDTPWDSDGHGTYCAAIAAGTGDGEPKYRYVGIAPQAKIVAVKIVKEGKTTIDSADAMRGIEWAMENKDKYDIRVMSISFGAIYSIPGVTNDGSSPISQLCNKAVDMGIVVAVAAGNGGPRPSSISPPGDAEKVITVGNVKDDHVLSPSSSRGPVVSFPNYYLKPDVCAPGTDIYSAKSGTYDEYVSKSGTSASAPHVAGVVALMLEANPDLTPEKIKNILRSTAEPGKTVFIQPTPNNQYGWGTIDALRAIENCTPREIPPFVYINPLGVVRGTVEITGTAKAYQGEIKKVEVKIDDSPYMMANGTEIWKYLWETTSYANGMHIISARAFDGKKYSYEYTITVTVDNILCKILTPANDVEVEDILGVKGICMGMNIKVVEYSIDGKDWKPAKRISNESWEEWFIEINVSHLKPGIHILKVRAFNGEIYSNIDEIQFRVRSNDVKTSTVSHLLEHTIGIIAGIIIIIIILVIFVGRNHKTN